MDHPVNFESLKPLDPFLLTEDKRRPMVFEAQRRLTLRHRENCEAYSNILKAIGFAAETMQTLEDIPYLPVGLFKSHDLLSIARQDVFKVLLSSGTSGQYPSRIHLDKASAALQSKVLAHSVNAFIGRSRLPMIIFDTPSVLKNRNSFSARGAGILGFSMFGRDRLFVLDDDMQIEKEKLARFLDQHRGKKLLLFGFTFMLWKYFFLKIRQTGLDVDLSRGVLFHGGGWKKLANEQVSVKEFKRVLEQTTGLTEVHNYYGMVEQTGSIFVECENGCMHTSIYNDVLVRSPADLSVLGPGRRGIIQTFSILPTSYPGHSLLTEDEGELVGLDDCACGRTGPHFLIHGRLRNAEIRGCSDTYADVG